jgi:hypothetical protein
VNTKAKGARAERRARRCSKCRDGASYPLAPASGRSIWWRSAAQGCAWCRSSAIVGPGHIERAALTAFNNFARGATRELWLFYDRRRGPQIEVL